MDAERDAGVSASVSPGGVTSPIKEADRAPPAGTAAGAKGREPRAAAGNRFEVVREKVASFGTAQRAGSRHGAGGAEV